MTDSSNEIPHPPDEFLRREVASRWLATGPGQTKAETRSPPSSDAPPIRSDTVAPVEWPEAIRRLVGGDPRTAQRVIERIELGSLAIEAIEAMRSPDGGFAAVALAVRNPGRTLGLVLSPLQAPSHRAAAEATVRHLIESVRGSGAFLMQAMFDPSRRVEIGATADAGFRHLARLRFMDGDLARLNRQELPLASSVSIEACGRSDPRELAVLLGRTYIETLDCPGLAGLRRPDDVLTGHRASGRFDPDLWFMLRIDGRPAGLSLLNPNPEAGCTELVYFGLVPEARGRGLATTLLRHSLARIGDHSPARIALAVDDRNIAALRLYRRHGFVPGGLRTALVRPLP
jgi:GNAT superfamily N-acetyltransferase